MYTPRAFAETDLAALDGLLARNPFVTLITTVGDAPMVSHLPVLYSRTAAAVLIEGHWARANPQARHAGPAMVIVHGPQAYISPGWYADKEAASRVPTWNYAVAHLRGTLQPSEDASFLAGIVERLSTRHESELGSDWRYEHERPSHRSQLRGITGFRFTPADIELTFKLSQNHPVANVEGAAAALHRLGGEDNVAVADLMRERLVPRAGDMGAA